MNATIDVTRPWLMEIGDNLQIAKGVTILTHGYDWFVLKENYILIFLIEGGYIGNSVFIDVKSTIWKGVRVWNMLSIQKEMSERVGWKSVEWIFLDVYGCISQCYIP